MLTFGVAAAIIAWLIASVAHSLFAHPAVRPSATSTRRADPGASRMCQVLVDQAAIARWRRPPRPLARPVDDYNRKRADVHLAVAPAALARTDADAFARDHIVGHLAERLEDRRSSLTTSCMTSSSERHARGASSQAG